MRRWWWGKDGNDDGRWRMEDGRSDEPHVTLSAARGLASNFNARCFAALSMTPLASSPTSIFHPPSSSFPFSSGRHSPLFLQLPDLVEPTRMPPVGEPRF